MMFLTIFTINDYCHFRYAMLGNLDCSGRGEGRSNDNNVKHRQNISYKINRTSYDSSIYFDFL